jgi:predicted outer membrane repeat protein
MSRTVTRFPNFRTILPLCRIIAASFLLLPVVQVEASPPAAGPAQAFRGKLSKSQLLFTENLGQVADRDGHARAEVLFTAHSGNTRIFITASGIHYQMERTIYPEGFERNARHPEDPARQEDLRRKIQTQTQRFSMSLEGANPAPRIRREGLSAYTENFYLAHCPEGITGVHTYNRVVLEDVYPGIDWVLYTGKAGFKYDFLVHPGADASRIRMAVKDAWGISISGAGELVMKTGLGEVREAAPVASCEGKAVRAAFQQTESGRIRFSLGEWDPAKMLVIDPAVTWGTYYGDSGDDQGGYSSIDASGNVYLSGYTNSASGLATTGSLQTSNGGGMEDAYIVKFNSAGTRLWATYYGGPGWDDAVACAADAAGNAYLLGWSNSTSGIATTGSHQAANAGNTDAFLAKFSSTGTRSWSTYYGGASVDYPSDLVIDGSGNIIVSGYTASGNGIATTGAYQTLRDGTQDAFIARFGSSTGNLTWGTYYGGNGVEAGGDCAVDPSGNIYLAGYTTSTTGIFTTGGFQTSNAGTNDGYVVKFSSSGTPTWGSYYGGSGNDYISGCAADASGNMYVVGYTSGSTSGIATTGAHQTTYSGSDEGIILKCSSTGTRLWSTYLGGTGQDRIYNCATDAAGNLYIAGLSSSGTGIATPGALKPAYSSNTDAIMVRFNSNGTRSWGTYYGGTGWDEADAVAVDASGNLYLSGNTKSTTGIATAGGFQPAIDAGYDNYVARLSQLIANTATGTYCSGSAVNVPFTNSITANAGNVYTAQLSDANGSFASGTAIIGTLNSTSTSGTIAATLPAGAGSGTGYRIRVISSSPSDTGGDNAVNIAITGSRLYVNGSAAAWGTGGSWASPLQTVDSALRIANASSCVQEIWVKGGTYYPMAGTSVSASRDSSFRILRNGIKLYGGFAGTELALSARNIAANPTILSGDIGIGNDSTDNAYHVVTIIRPAGGIIDSSTRVDGFTVTGGNANNGGFYTLNGVGYNEQDGGGIYIGAVGPAANATGPYIAECTLTRNTAVYGGAIFAGQTNGSAGLTNFWLDRCTVIANKATGTGGGIFCNSSNAGRSHYLNTAFIGNTGPNGGAANNSGDSVDIINCSFTANTSGNGGALYNGSAAVLLSGSTLSSNTASSSGGGMYNTGSTVLITGSNFSDNIATTSGGGMYQSAAAITVTRSTFSNNSSLDQGGGIYSTGGQLSMAFDTVTLNIASARGGGIYGNNGTLKIDSSVVTRDSAVYGGGVYTTTTATVTFNSVRFEANKCSGGGAGVDNSGTATFNNCVFFQNLAKNAAGAIGTGAGLQMDNSVAVANIYSSVFANNTAAGSTDDGGGALMMYGGTANIFNSTFSGNATTSTLRPTSGGVTVLAGTTVNVTNSILWGPASGQIASAGTTNYSYSDIQGISSVANSFSADPLFVNPANPAGTDGIWGTADDGLRLMRCSPAVDTGNNAIIPSGVTTDFGGAARIRLARVDQGAYEYDGLNTLAITVATSNPTTCGGTDGSITISGLIPATIYGLSYSANGTPQPGISATADASGKITIAALPAGSYSNITARFGSCGSNVLAGPYVLNPPATPAISSVTGSNPTTCGGSDGSLSINGLTASTGGYTVTYFNGTSTITLNGQVTNTAGSIVIGSLTAGTYSNFSVTRANCGASSAAAVTLTPPAAPAAPTAGSNSPVCSGNTINLTASTVVNGTYAWTGPNGFSSSNQNPGIASATPTLSGTYSVTVTVANCTSAPATTAIVVNPTPVISSAAGTNPATCGGTGSIDISGLTASSSYAVSFTKNSIVQTPVTATANAGGTVTLSGLGTGIYTQFTATLAGCTSAPFSTAVTLSSPAAPAIPVISSNSPVCAGSNLNLSGPALSGVAYLWAGPNSFSSTAQSPAIAAATVAATGNYTLTVTSTATNCSSTSAPLNVVVNPIPAGTLGAISDPLTCGGATGTITINGLTPTTAYTVGYQKTTTVAGVPTTVSQSTTATSTAAGTMVVSGLTAGTYSGLVLTLNGCSSAAGAFASVTLNDPPTPAAPIASSNSPVCQGSALTLSATGQSGATYTWTGPGSYTASSRTPTVTTNMQNANTGTYSVTQTVAGCVSPAATTVVAIRTTPAAAGSISGPAAPCASTSQTYSIARIATATGYTWTLPSGWSITSSPADSSAIVVTTSANPGTVTLRVAAVNGCGTGTSSTLSINVNAIPAVPAAISGPAALCNGAAATYFVSAQTARATSYTWTIPGNPGAWTGNTATNTTDTQRVTAGAGSGWVSVTANNVCGNSAPQGIYVNVTSKPSTPAPISGSTSPCIATTQSYSTIAVFGATSYTWTYPASWTAPTPASATNSTSTTVGNGGGTITVTASNQCGSSGVQTLNVAATLLAGQPSVISGPTTACIGNINVYRVTPGSGGTTNSYIWTLPAGWYGISDSAAMYASAASTGGTITVTPVGVCGPGPSRSLTVTTTAVVVPSVSVTASAGTGGVLLCQGVADTFRATAVNGGTAPVYQWTKNGRNVGTGAAVYIDNTLRNGDTITATLRSSLPCVTLSRVTATPLVVQVTPNVIPGININTTPPTTFCEGAPVQFITNINAGGTAPVYQWYRNDTLVAGQSGPVYNGSGRNGDTLRAVLISNALCRSADTTYSNKVGLQVLPVVVPTVTVSAGTSFPILPGTPVTFTAVNTFGGPNPDYQWQRNGVDIPAATGSSYTTDQLRNDDRISVRMISYAPCAMPDHVTSDDLRITVGSATGVSGGNSNAALDLYPNPTNGQFTVRVDDPQAVAGGRVRIDVLNVLGQSVYKTEVVPGTQKWSYEVYLDESFAGGTYMVRITSGDRSVVKPVTLLR